MSQLVLAGAVILAVLAAIWFVAGRLGVKLGGWLALLGFVTMFVGYLAIAFPLQARGAVLGLWVTELFAIALPAVAILRGAGVKLAPYLGLRAPTPKALLVAAIAAAANQPVVSLLTYAARELLPSDWIVDFDAKQSMLNEIFKGHALPMVATVVIAAPLCEELFFRGFALPAFSRDLGLALAALFSAALFSAIHLDRVGFIGLWEIGLLLSVLRIWSGSIWPAILAHAVNNAIAGGAFMLGYQESSAAPPAWFLALGFVLFAAGLYLAVQVLRTRQQLGLEEPRPGVDEAGRFRLGRARLPSAIWLLAVVGGLGLVYSAQRAVPSQPAPVELPPGEAP